MTDTIDATSEQQAQEAQGVQASEPDTDTAGRSKPVYGMLEVADEVPAQDAPKRSGGGPNMRLHDLLEQIMVTDELAGKWVKIVGYSTPNGAKLAYDAIEDGSRIIPDGDFDFEVRRVTEGGSGKRVSELWARYNGVA